MEGAAMKCEEARELLDAYHDGEMRPSTLAAVKTHLRTCASCSAELAAHETIRSKVRSLARTPAPAAFPSKLHKSFVAASNEAGLRLNVRSLRAMSASHLLAIALGGAVVFAFVHGRDSRSFVVQEVIDAH